MVDTLGIEPPSSFHVRRRLNTAKLWNNIDASLWSQISEDVFDFMISYLPFHQKSIRSELAKLFSIGIFHLSCKVITLSLFYDTQRNMKGARVPSLIVFLFFIVITLTLYMHQAKLIRNREMYRRVESNKICRAEDSSTEPFEDFVNYPCLSKDAGNSSTSKTDCLRSISMAKNKFCDIPNNRCVPLNKINQDICTYDPKIDIVSEFIHKDGAWEEKLVDNLVQVLQRYRNLTFLDLGCNIGVYTIAAASRNTHAVCVDANVENLRLVYKSAHLGNVQKFVTIIWNALSDYRGEVYLKVVKGNAGASRLGNTEKHGMTISKHLRVKTVLLDDLEWLFRGKQLFMKIDLEAYELTVLRGATEFFKKIDVRFIQMELLEKDTFHAVVDILYSWGYMMFKDLSGKVRLDRQDFALPHWPGDVYFIKLIHLHKQ